LGAFVEQLLAGGPAGVEVGDGLLDLVGVRLGGGAAAAGVSGLAGDIAPAATQDGGGVADPGEDG
jgi:hypothetical protein